MKNTFAVLVLIVAAAYGTAQDAETRKATKASCTFTTFPLFVRLLNGSEVYLSPNGINDFQTVVGGAEIIPGPASASFIRWSNGGITFPLGKVNNGWLIDRNDLGISIGVEALGHPSVTQILLDGSSVTPIILGPNPSDPFYVSGINNWGSMVGVYFTFNSGSVTAHGFKRGKDGAIIPLEYPGTVPGRTSPSRINGNGMIVGQYITPDQHNHGFVYYQRRFATLDYPGGVWTSLIDISNAGTIVGLTRVSGFPFPFLYRDGNFKIISFPKAFETEVLGISPRLGWIVGVARFIGHDEGFIAKCH